MPNAPAIRRNEDGSFTMCSKNDCCPTIKFNEEDGSAVISDEGREIKFDRDQLSLLGQTIMMRSWKGQIAK